MTWIRTGFVIAVVVLIGGTIISAFTASNAVPSTRAGEVTDAVTIQKLTPSSCAAIAATVLVNGSGTFGGSGSSELLLGSSVIDSITAGGGNDCLVGGGANDTLNGGQGTDVCLGGPGTDTFSGCETQAQ